MFYISMPRMYYYVPGCYSLAGMIYVCVLFCCFGMCFRCLFRNVPLLFCFVCLECVPVCFSTCSLFTECVCDVLLCLLLFSGFVCHYHNVSFAWSGMSY